MAQTGFTPIVTYNTATATTIPSAANLAQGELAVNVTDKKLYTKDSGGNVVLLASSGGDVTGPASSTNLAIPTFSGTGGKTLLDNAGATISAGVITATGFSGPLTGNVTGNVSGSSGSCTGNAATVTTNANLTGPITSVGNATSIASQTGTGTKFVVDTSPTLVTPVLGVATATSINKMAITAPATSSTLAVADGKTLTANKTLTLDGTDSTTQTFPTTSATIARTDAAQTFTGTQTFSGLITPASIEVTGNAIVGAASAFEAFVSADVIYTGAVNRTTTNYLPFTYTGSKHTWRLGATTTGGITGSMVLNANGALALVGASTTANGVGITFPATQSASTDANTLDDYEESTWTPTITATTGSYTTVTSQSGSYTKIGRQVTLRWYFVVSNKGTGSGSVNISNLPFASNVSAGNFYAGCGYDTSAGLAQICYMTTTTSIDVAKYDGTDPIIAGRGQVGQLIYFV